MRRYFLLLATALLLPVAPCATSTPAPTQSAQPEYKPIATIKDIMDSMVDPSADYIWDSVGVQVSEAGVIARAPKTDDDWKEERRRVMLLLEAPNLLVMPGRRVAKAGDKSENPGIELGPEEIESLINNDRATFNGLAWKLQEAAMEQLKMVDAKDAEGLLDKGSELDAACEGCHRKYWYPNEVLEESAQPAPKPTEEKK